MPSPRISAIEAAELSHQSARSLPADRAPRCDSTKFFSLFTYAPNLLHQICKEVDMTTVTPNTSTAAEENPRHTMRRNETPAIRSTEGNPRMVRLTVNLPSDLAEQMRDAVYWTPGLTLAWMIARAVRVMMAEMESTNQGPFPKRAKPLRAGRPRLVGQSMKIQPPPPARAQSCTGEHPLRARVLSEPTNE